MPFIEIIKTIQMAPDGIHTKNYVAGNKMEVEQNVADLLVNKFDAAIYCEKEVEK